jgi:hypothetical protein
MAGHAGGAGGGNGVIPCGEARIRRLARAGDFEHPGEADDFGRHEFTDTGTVEVQRCEIPVSVIGAGIEESFELKESSCFEMGDFLTGRQSDG